MEDTTEKGTQVKEVFISAAPNSRRFDKISEAIGGAEANITSYDIVATIDGSERKETLGAYNKQRFPGSRQSTMPKFDREKNMFLIRRADGTYWTQADIDKAVKEIPAMYDQFHPKAGERIERSNISDLGDAFINNKLFRMELFEGEEGLKIHGMREQLQEDMMRGNRSFMDESVDGIRSSEVEYIIRNPEMAEKRENTIREDKEYAMELYTDMKTDPERMRQVLIMFGVEPDESASTSSLRNQVFKKVDDNSTTDRGLSYQKLFIKYAGMPKDTLQLQSTVALATLRRILWERAGTYVFEDTPIANTFEGMIDFFNNPANKHIFDSVLFQLKEGKK